MKENIDFSIGSEWRKWDLHFHTPSSHDYENKSITDEEIINILLQNNISVVCVTDHYIIDNKRINNLQTLGKNKVTVLPGIEFCSELGGSESVHFIGIFSESADIESIWIKLQGNQNLTPEDIVSRGGYQNIQCDLIETCDLIHELGGITSIHAGTKTNTVENIKNSLLVKMEQKKRILSECIDILEIGKLEDADNYETIVFKNIKFRLPMIICSDNHDINNYKEKCGCWIKADPTFEGLKQIIFEPQNRVQICNDIPDLNRDNCINMITVDKDWFPQKTLTLNKGLVSIIGARGSGKTALLDFIALGANSYYNYKASFLGKAKKEVSPLKVNIQYNGNEISTDFIPDLEYSEPYAKYLSQQFVEKLCSEDGSTELLQDEIERFIFENIDVVERIGTSNFQELKYLKIRSFESVISSLKNRINDLNIEISRIHHLQTIELPIKEKEKLKIVSDLNDSTSKLPKLDKSIQNKAILEYEQLNSQFVTLGNELKYEWTVITNIEQVKADILLFSSSILSKNEYFKNELSKLNVDVNILSEFDNNNNYDLIITNISRIIEEKKTIFYKRYGIKESPAENTYLFQKQKLENIKQQMNQYTENEKLYIKKTNEIEQLKNTLTEIINQINNINSLNFKELQSERLKTYKLIFEEILKEKEMLELLYKPLVEKLKNKKEESLGFYVKINVDINTWSSEGEKLIDRRKIAELHCNKSLFDLANEKLFEIWSNCDLDSLEKAIDNFTNDEARKMSKILLNSDSYTKLADWLFSTSHISISYEMTFNGLPLKRLSPGTKGILLMLLYLGVDKNDTRPLLIDQPEDNLDPESVYDVLVPYFKEAKKRRQIIMVTHNPNLVVATDSDQVIIAQNETNELNKLPIFSYCGGGLENPEVVKKVCKVLEGGEKAFIKRALRYSMQNQTSFPHIPKNAIGSTE